MASSNPTQSETVKNELFRGKLVSKFLQVISENRSYNIPLSSSNVEQVRSSSSLFSPRSSRSWQYLDLCWRGEPIVIDVTLMHKPRNPRLVESSPKKDSSRNSSAKESSPIYCSCDHQEIKGGKILERWLIDQHEIGNRGGSSPGCRQLKNTTSDTLHKNTLTLMRCLLELIRHLPADTIFKELRESNRIPPFTIEPIISSFVEPFTGREETLMKHVSLFPLDTPSGKLSISVFFRSSLPHFMFEPQTPLPTVIIDKYVDKMNRLREWSKPQSSAPISPSPAQPKLYSIATQSPEVAPVHIPAANRSEVEKPSSPPGASSWILISGSSNECGDLDEFVFSTPLGFEDYCMVDFRTKYCECKDDTSSAAAVSSEATSSVPNATTDAMKELEMLLLSLR